jgi:hypothetical protein
METEVSMVYANREMKPLILSLRKKLKFISLLLIFAPKSLTSNLLP